MTQEKFNEMMQNYLIAQGKQSATWEKEACDWAVAQGLLKGADGMGIMPKRLITRGEMVTILKRFWEMIKK